MRALSPDAAVAGVRPVSTSRDIYMQQEAQAGWFSGGGVVLYTERSQFTPGQGSGVRGQGSGETPRVQV